MFFYVSFTLALVAIACGALLMRAVPPEARKASLTVGVLIADVLMTFPLAVHEVNNSMVEGGNSALVKIGSYLSTTAIDTLSLIGIEIRIEEFMEVVEGASLVPWFGALYLITLRLLYIATPAILAIAAYSFFTSQFSKTRVRRAVGKWNMQDGRIYVFRNLNSRSIEFVKSIFWADTSETKKPSLFGRLSAQWARTPTFASAKSGNPLCVFTDVSRDAKEKYSSDISLLYGLPVHFTEIELKEFFRFLSRRKRSEIATLQDLHVFFFADEEGDNLSNAINFIEFLASEVPLEDKAVADKEKYSDLELMASVDTAMSGKCAETSARFYKGTPRYHVYSACHGRSDEIALDSIDGSEGIDIRIIDEGREVVYDLIWNHPIVPKTNVSSSEINTPSSSSNIDIIIVGCGHYGFEALKACCWAGIYPNTRTNIHVIDMKDPITFNDEVSFWCPGLVQTNLIEVYYHQADVTAPSFLTALETIRRGGALPTFPIVSPNDASARRSKALTEQSIPYCIISVGQDDLNTDTAITVRRFFYGDGVAPIIIPDIYVDIYDKKRHGVIDQLKARDQAFSFEAFGGITSIFNEKHIVFSPIESLAQNVNASYSYMFTDRRDGNPKGSPPHSSTGIDYEVAVLENVPFSEHLNQFLFLGYSAWQMNRLSSITNAIGLKAKLHYLGFDLSDDAKEETISTGSTLRALIHRLSPEEFGVLKRWEHDRWMLFYFGEGWTSESSETSEEFRIRGLNDKDCKRHDSHLLMRHPYLCDYDKMKTIATELKRDDPSKHDEHLIRDIPAILEDALSLTGVKYLLTRVDNYRLEDNHDRIL